ncbi:hypothetical protein [Gordonia sputi]
MTRPQPPFTANQVSVLAAAIADRIVDWTWPAVVRAAGIELPAEICVDVAQQGLRPRTGRARAHR